MAPMARGDGERGRMACSGGGLRGASSEPRCYCIFIVTRLSYRRAPVTFSYLVPTASYSLSLDVFQPGVGQIWEKLSGFFQTAGAVPIAAAPSVHGLPKRNGSIDLAETLRTVLASLAARAHETYDEIIAILKSQHRVKSIPLEIDATFWGEEYAAEAPAGRSRRTVC